ncbi:MAG: LLM class F420-dependent oxidoreductase [Actinobacteria bacterium]|nr:LLM class F420-dependent oxidoreductase [Actinomycetota bacterium]
MPGDLGPIGIWTFALDTVPATVAREMVAEIEELGYGAIWLPEAIGRDPLVASALTLAASDRVKVCTGVASIYARAAMTMTSGWKPLSAAFPGRFLLGLGVSHQMAVEGMRQQTYGPPLASMRAYLDAMDGALYVGAEPAVAPERCLAALGPKMLELAADRTRGAHTYYVPPEHTAFARETMGPDALLAPEQKVILETDPAVARELARANIGYYLALPNYANNLRRLGFTEDDITQCSDRLVDAIVAWGDVETVRARVQAHLDAGADHVCLQVLPFDDPIRIRRDWQTLAATLL